MTTRRRGLYARESQIVAVKGKDRNDPRWWWDTEPGGLAPSVYPEGLIAMLDARQGWAR